MNMNGLFDVHARTTKEEEVSADGKLYMHLICLVVSLRLLT